jgi:prephenate dehydrogenase
VTIHPGAPAGPGTLLPAGVVIIGTGLIGTSVGLALRARGVRVWLADGDPRAAGLAASLGAGDLLSAGPPAAAPGSAGVPDPAPGSAGVPGPAPGSAGVPGPAPRSGDVPGSAPRSGDVPGSAPVASGVSAAAPGSAGVPAFAPPPGGPADLAVLAVPPDAVAPVLAAAQAAGLAACYTDVASVKARPLAAARALGCDLARYVPGHPLAGRERSGPAAARADLFHGRPWALCPAAETTPRAVACVTSLVTACGAEPVTAAADEHDRWVALVSHAPHVVASAMAARLASAPDGALALAGQGLRDVTRIAAGDTALWTQILLANAAGVSEVLALVADDLRQAAAALADAEAAAGDPAAPGAAPPAGGAEPGQPGRADEKAGPRLAALLDAGGAGVGRIPGKHAGPATRYAIVQVVIPDQPGELARLFQAAGEAGVNIEDFGIEHSPGLPSGVAELAVKPAAAGPLAAALSARGWPAYAAPPPSGP